MKKILSITIPALLFLFLAATMLSPQKENNIEKYTYQKKNQSKGGGMVMFESLNDFFTGNIITSRKRIAKTIFDNDVNHDYTDPNNWDIHQLNFYEPIVYMFSNEEIKVKGEEMEVLKSFLNSNHCIFIAADTIELEGYKFPYAGTLPFDIKDSSDFVYSFPAHSVGDSSKNIKAKLIPNSYYFFTDADKDKNTGWEPLAYIQGANDKNKYCFLMKMKPNEYFRWNIYLCSMPKLLSNKYILTEKKGNLNAVTESVITQMPEAYQVIWDEFYKGNYHLKLESADDNPSIMRYIMAQPALQIAFYLTLIMMGLYAGFEMKRRQRIIPIFAKPQNATLEFTETIGRLYYKNQDHKNIAEKRIKYFYEYIRNRYNIQLQHHDKEFAAILSAKSGLDLQIVHSLAHKINKAKTQKQISEDDLIELNMGLMQFYDKVRNT